MSIEWHCDPPYTHVYCDICDATHEIMRSDDLARQYEHRPGCLRIQPEVQSPLTLDQYQSRSAATAVYPRIRVIIDDDAPIEAPWLYPLLGLLGEAGELAEKFKKLLRDDHGVMTEARASAIAKERGDPLWYLARLSEAAGTSLGADAQLNLDKLADRAARAKLGGDGDNR